MSTILTKAINGTTFLHLTANYPCQQNQLKSYICFKDFKVVHENSVCQCDPI
jgi:hypothetical protein